MPKSTLRERLAAIVEAVFDGNPYQAARAANIQPSVLHRLLHNETEAQLRTVRRLADAYGVTVGWLFGDEDAVEARERDVPVWYWLIVAFYRRRQRPTREWLEGAKPISSETKRIISAYRAFHLIDFPVELSLPEAQALFGSKGEPQRMRNALRALGDAEIALLDRVLTRLRTLGVKSENSGALLVANPIDRGGSRA